MTEYTIIHIPHASLYIPEDIRRELLLTDNEIDAQLLRMTDRYTDELFAWDGAQIHRNTVSRLVFDPERFRDEQDESMERFGMGAIYRRTADAQPLRELTGSKREDLLRRFYDPYHRELTDKVAACLLHYGKCLIIDGHSFPSRPLPFETETGGKRHRPDLCIGADTCHTPQNLVKKVRDFIEDSGYSADINHPFAGALVPMRYYGKDERVTSIMLEVNRKLYMDETTGEKNQGFEKTAALVRGIMALIIQDS